MRWVNLAGKHSPAAVVAALGIHSAAPRFGVPLLQMKVQEIQLCDHRDVHQLSHYQTRNTNVCIHISTK